MVFPGSAVPQGVIILDLRPKELPTSKVCCSHGQVQEQNETKLNHSSAPKDGKVHLALRETWQGWGENKELGTTHASYYSPLPWSKILIFF